MNSGVIKKIFKEDNLDEQKLAYYTNIYKSIEKEFNEKKFNFDNLTLYPEKIYILSRYLEFNGYGFLYNKITKEDFSENLVSLANLLIDSNLILRPKLNISSTLKSNSIKYKKEFGLSEKYTVTYTAPGIPFEIYSIDYKKSSNINCDIKDSNNISIDINIDQNKEINFRETIVVYTSYGVEKIELIVECEKSLEKNILLDDFNEFIEKCHISLSDAKEIFMNNEFRIWLDKKSYKTQVINYDEAINLSSSILIGKNLKNNNKQKEILEKAFGVFCRLNNIKINDIDYSLKKSEVLSKEIDTYLGSDMVMNTKIENEELDLKQLHFLNKSEVNKLNDLLNTKKEIKINVNDKKYNINRKENKVNCKLRLFMAFIKNIFCRKRK